MSSSFAALCLIAAAVIAAVLVAGSSAGGGAQPERRFDFDPPASPATAEPQDGSLVELQEAIDRVVERVRRAADAAVEAGRQAAREAQADLAQGPPASADRDASALPPPGPEDAASDSACVTNRDVSAGVSRISVRCERRVVAEDGSSSSVTVSTSSSTSVSSVSSDSR